MATMNLKTLALLPAAALAGLALVSPSASDAAAPPGALDAQTYAIDNAHSAVLFRCEHLGIGQAWGRFNQATGSLAYDEAAPEKSSIELSIDAASVDTNNSGRDDHLRNADFLSAKEFPTIEFKSTKVAQTDAGLEVTGDLTLHGVTKPATAQVTHVASGEDPWGNVRVGFEGRFTVDRTDFGMTYMSDGGLGNEVHLIVSLEATRKK
jgi:polyisoprenoid-binding protein YceI